MSVRIDRVDTRARLKPRRDPYWLRLTRGRYIGFRKMVAGATGTWLTRFYDGERYQQKPLGDFAELSEKERYDAAKCAAEEWFQHIDKGGTTERTTVKAACEAYVDERKLEKGEASAVDAKGRFTRLVYDDPIARIDLQKLAPRHVADWKKRVLAKGGTHGSFNRNAAALRAALNLAHSRRDVSSNHAWTGELKPYKDADGRRELYLKRPSRLKLFENASAEAKRFIKTLLLLPLRPGDVAKLVVSNFDAHHKSLTVPAGKTKKREIPLSSDAVAHFKECAKDKLPGAWLVSRDTTGAQWNRFDWRDAIKEAADAAKLPAATCAYSLRHAAITDMVTGGTDLFTIAKLSGTSVAMIEKHYGHLQREHAREALEKLALA